MGPKNRATETKGPRQSRRGSLAVSKTLASRYVGGKWLGVYHRVSEAYSRAGGLERLGDGRTPPTVTDLSLLLTSARRCPQVGIGEAQRIPGVHETTRRAWSERGLFNDFGQFSLPSKDLKSTQS